MKPGTLLLIITLNVAALVLITFLYPQLMISPGKPIAAHAELADDCFACHSAFVGSPKEKCIACHKVDEIGKITTTGLPIANENKNVAFHQQLVEQDCVACHSDHNGVKAFRPIGQFSHNLLESSLSEKCQSCHESPIDKLHSQISGNCSQCHTQDAWTPASFDHDEYFRFDRHHDTECETCHVNNDYSKYTCYGCHEHSRSKIRKEHYEEGIRDYEQCTECHRSGDEHEAKRIWRNSEKRNSGDSGWNRYKEHDDD
jgi:hypothetical protein